jgi:hypothetical protein
MFSQTIKIKVSLHCLLRQSNREENQMSGNPLFISVLNTPISQPLTSTPRTQRARQWGTNQSNLPRKPQPEEINLL